MCGAGRICKKGRLRSAAHVDRLPWALIIDAVLMSCYFLEILDMLNLAFEAEAKIHGFDWFVAIIIAQAELRHLDGDFLDVVMDFGKDHIAFDFLPRKTELIIRILGLGFYVCLRF